MAPAREVSAPPAFDTLGRDAYYWTRLRELVDDAGYTLEDVVRNWQAYVMRRDLIRFIAHYELFKRVVDLPGCIVELGVYRGASFFTWTNLIETFAPFDRHRHVYGFDSFEGLQRFLSQDGADAAGAIKTNDLTKRYVGAFGVKAAELEALVEMHNADAMIPGTRRTRLVVGDIMETLPRFVAENPGLRISLIHFDVDLYEPTKLGLELLYPLVVRGGVLAFDEYAFLDWPGETKAVDEFFGGFPPGERPRIEKMPFAQAPAFVVKP